MEERRKEDIEAELRSLTTRDVQLWSMGFLIMAVLAVGVVAIAVPSVSQSAVRVQIRYIPQLALGLVSLVVLLNVYIATKKKELGQTRAALIRELVLNEQLQHLSLTDPETRLFGVSYLHHLFTSESKRSNRLGSATALLVLDAAWKKVPGAQDRDKEILLDAVDLLRATFRGSDTIVRLADARFLVVMPATTPDQAGIALQRLNRAVDEWNLDTERVEMLLSWVIGSCAPGEDLWMILRKSEEELDSLRDSRRIQEFLPA